MKKQSNIRSYLLGVGIVFLLMSSCRTNVHLSSIRHVLEQQDSYAQKAHPGYGQFIKEQQALELQALADQEKLPIKNSKPITTETPDD